MVEVGLRLDAEPRVVAEPPDLADALDRAPQARAAFDRLPYGPATKVTVTGKPQVTVLASGFS